jgi:2-iminoacetate synthase
VAAADEARVWAALDAEAPGEDELAALLSPAAGRLLEALAQRARDLTWRHFGRTISLYIPLYLSDYCTGGCIYCGFAADRPQPRRRLEMREIRSELDAVSAMGLEEVLLLTGERTPQADFDYLREAVSEAAQRLHTVAVEAFPMTVEEYVELVAAGCTGVTLYQETYDPAQYDRLHRWGPKKDYAHRLDAPARFLSAGMRSGGLGVLLGVSEPLFDAVALFRHALHLRRSFWQSGITISFPRVCPQAGGFVPPWPVSESFLAQLIFAFRICLPDVPLVLSTRESPRFRDGIAGVGISKMSVASRTTVGGYGGPPVSHEGQFHVNDGRDVEAFCAALRAKGLEPVFKNWDAVYR